MFRENAMSAATSLVVIARAASNRLAWLAFSWISRWFLELCALWNVFLTVHGVQGEQTPAQVQCRDHFLGGGDFVALLRDRQMAEYDLAIDIKGAQHMCCLAVIESVEAAA